MSVNKAYLLGNVGKDPDVRANDNGKWATFTLATTDRAYTTKSGTQVPERTEWHNIVVSHPGLVGVVEQYVRKGTKLFIEGKIQGHQAVHRGQDQDKEVHRPQQQRKVRHRNLR